MSHLPSAPRLPGLYDSPSRSGTWERWIGSLDRRRSHAFENGNGSSSGHIVAVRGLIANFPSLSDRPNKTGDSPAAHHHRARIIMISARAFRRPDPNASSRQLGLIERFSSRNCGFGAEQYLPTQRPPLQAFASVRAARRKQHNRRKHLGPDVCEVGQRVACGFMKRPPFPISCSLYPRKILLSRNQT